MRRLLKFFKDPFAQVGMVSMVLITLALADGYWAYITPAPADKLAEFFEDVAFGSDYGKGTEYVVKWQGELRIYIAGKPDSGQRKELELVLETLSRLSGLNMTFDQSKKANYAIHFIKRGNLLNTAEAYQPSLPMPDSQPESIRCYAIDWRNKIDDQIYVIYHAIALISTDLPQENFFRAFIGKLARKAPYKWNSSCLREELMQNLGLPKDSDYVSPSVVNNNAHHDIYSINDMILIRTLYDPRIHVGMPKAEAMKIVRETIIPELINAYENHGEEALYQK